MARNLVLLPSGALGLSSGGALSVADDAGGCTPCCGGEPGGGPCQCGRIDDGQTACGVPLDPDHPNGPHPGTPLRIRIRLTLEALIQRTLNGVTTDQYRHNAKSYEADWTYIKASQRGESAPCAIRTPGGFPQSGEQPSIILLTEEVPFGGAGQFGFLSTIGDAGASVADRAGWASDGRTQWFNSGPVNYSGPAGGGVAIQSDFSLSNAVGLTTMVGRAAWSSGSPLITAERRAGRLLNAANVAQLRATFGTVTAATYAGTQTIARDGCTFTLRDEAALDFAASFGGANDRTTWMMRASWEASVSIGLGLCTPTPGIRGGGLVSDLLGMMGA